ncbi:MAG: glycosyltransferase family 39 protein [Candidatus Omnitrophica bacterium]|nr:glycosyltransferase family 39 protein [Candidatus Omnitrophota bacterium]
MSIIRIIKNNKYLIVIIILFVFQNSFFINKAFHIDDPSTVEIAKAINIHPLKPPQIFLSNPILMGYYYSPIIRIFGEKEFWFHLFYLPFSLLTIISMFFLSLRFTQGSLLPVIFLMVTPAFIISSQSVMLDIPLLGFFLAAVATFIFGIDKNNRLLLLLSGLLAGIAILIKYSGIMILPILFIYVLLNSKIEKIKFLFIPLFIFILWNIYCILIYKDAIFFLALSGKLASYFLNRIGIRLFASLSFLSGTSIIIVFLSFFLLQKKTFFLPLLSATSGFLPFLIKDTLNNYSFFEKTFLAILLVSSSYIILLILQDGFKKNNKDSLFFSLWFLLIFIFINLINFIAARFILLLLPPLFLFIYNELIIYKPKIVRFKVKIISSIFISLLVSLLLAIGDYQFAEIYRDIFYVFKKVVPLDKKVYFCDSYTYYYSWGYDYYLKKNRGLKYRREKNLSIKNAIFITPTEQVLPIIIEGLGGPLNNKDRLINSIYYKGNIVLHNQRFHAGFYSHDWGLLPFYLSFHKVPLEVFKIYYISNSPQEVK